MTTITEPCVIHGLPEDEYHADCVPGGSLSQSSAKLLLHPGGAARLKWAMDNPPERRPQFEFGKAAHAKVLGIGVDVVVSEWDDYRTKAAREWRDEQQAAGRVVLSRADAERIDAMALQLEAHPTAVAVLAGADREVSMFAQDDVTGVWLRGRCDAGGEGGFVDYKTAASADPDKFAAAVVNYGYHLQRAWYARLSELTGAGYGDRFVFVVQEKNPPHLVSVIELDDSFTQLGSDEMRRVIDIYAECRRTGEWPGYDPGVTLIAPPVWAYPDIELDPIGA